MAQQRHLAHAPITEAVIDLRVEIEEGIDVSSLDTATIEAATGYKRIGPLVAGEFGIIIDMEGAQGAAVSQDGVRTLGSRFHSADEKYVAQLSIHGLTFSRLAPYENWPTLTAEARRVWAVYSRCIKPRNISRVATRFINDLRLPMNSGAEFTTYLTSSLGLHDPAFRGISSFLVQYEGRDADSQATVRCTQALRPERYDGVLPVIIDIDVFRVQQFSFDETRVWAYLDRLRDIKNRVFFSLLTEACVELYK
jgi:uncharacterized protein (TIGR04255 family)